MERSSKSNGFKRKNSRRTRDAGGAMDLAGRVAEAGGAMGFGLEADPSSSSSPWDVNDDDMDHNERTSAGLYGRRVSGAMSCIHQARLFDTPSTRNNDGENMATTGNSTKGGGSTADNRSRRMARGATTLVSKDRSRLSRFSRATLNSNATSYATPAVHVVCAISENLARETCVASLDAGAATTLQVTKQGNGQTYAETLAYLEVLKPHEVLLNEGRRTSQLTRKILELYNVQGFSLANHSLHATETTRRRRTTTTNSNKNRRRGHRRRGRQCESSGATNATDYNEATTVQEQESEEDRFGSCATGTVVKFISRSCFDQTKGAELLRRISREETYDAHVVEEYILLSSAHAVLNYTQQALGSNFSSGCLFLSINSGGNNRMAIGRTTLLQLELLVNSQTGKVKNSLVGSIDKTKTTAGSRLLRTNLMSPPTQVETINARLELVETFLQSEDFFYDVLNHLSHLPDVDKMLTNIALVPRKKKKQDEGFESTTVRLASRGISALVCIKSVLTACPAFVNVLKNQLASIEEQNGQQNPTPAAGEQQQGQRYAADDSTHRTERTSLLIGLGGGSSGGNSTMNRPERCHLLRAIVFAMSQPALAEVLDAVSDVFTATTDYIRNAEAMRHQECFALKVDDNGVMNVLRKAFLANVDDIFAKADEYAEKFGFQVSVKYSGSRGHFLVIPADVGKDLPQVFLLPTVSGRHIHCSTEEVNSLNLRAQENVHDLLVMTYDQIQNVLDIAREHYDAIAALCDAIALLDLCHSFADTVSLSRLPWCKPQVSKHPIYDESGQAGNQLVINNGRFGIDVGTAEGGPDTYIANDTYATGEKRFTLITGINGSGKSTYLKQLAIIVVLAHCGSYVPAERALIPLRDRLCTRIGNSDNQENNISTFMLEMKETAFICNSANENSLVLIDELGRATSNEDGVAIAWSVAEYILKKRSMAFFVTHYPQLSRLADIYPSVQNVHLEASVTKGDNGGIDYTHKVKSGACAVSTDYGVELAACCGWPRDVVEEARMIESDVEALLPSEGPCASETNTRRRAFEILSTIGETLKGFIQVQQGQSFRSIRTELHGLHRVHLPQEGQVDLLLAMDQLLFREPPPPPVQMQQQQGEHEVDNIDVDNHHHHHQDPAAAKTTRHHEESNGDETSSLSSNDGLNDDDDDSSDSSSSSSSSDSSISDARP